jgi:hypothetical protein
LFYWKQSCSSIAEVAKQKQTALKIKMTDIHNETVTLSLPLTRLLIEPAKVHMTGPAFANTCMIGIFLSNTNF